MMNKERKSAVATDLIRMKYKGQEKQEERNLFFLYKEITCNWYPTKNTAKEVKDIDNTIFYSSAGATEHTSQ